MNEEEYVAAIAEDEDRYLAAVDLVGRSGANTYQLRWQDDVEPTIWLSVCTHNVNGEKVYDVGAGLNPLQATCRLVDQLVDGAICTHCHKPTGVVHHHEDEPAFAFICWYVYDPELKTFRRSCEGDAP